LQQINFMRTHHTCRYIHINTPITDTHIHDTYPHHYIHVYEFFTSIFSRLVDGITMWVKLSDWSKKLQHNYSNKDYTF
jgi:hypothetical protein